MEDWIRNVEHLMGADYYDEPCPLLEEEFESDNSPNSLIGRTDAFLNQTDASDEVIHEIRDHYITDVLEKTVEKIVAKARCGVCRCTICYRSSREIDAPQNIFYCVLYLW